MIALGRLAATHDDGSFRVSAGRIICFRPHRELDLSEVLKLPSSG